MSALQDIADEVTRRGEATLDDLATVFPKMTREQITSALHNAKANGLVMVLRNGARRSGVPPVWGPQAADDKDPPRKPVDISSWVRPVSSVWELGTRAAQGATT